LLHGTQVLKELVQPWSMSDRCVCADSYFASVGAVEELQRMRMRFIGVVKTSTRRFPMDYLSNLRFYNHGDRHGVVTKDADGNPIMLAFVWVDRERRYFIASAGSLAEGEPYHRNRWRQVSEEPNAEPERVELTVPQPRAAEIYYKVCAKIDQHNRDRQATLGIERKLVTNDWSMRVNLSIFAMIVVDTWRVYSGLTFDQNNGETQKEFYGRLATELIDNKFDFIGRSSARAKDNNNNDDDDAFDSPVIDRNTGVARSGVDAHITPTKRRQRDVRGNEKTHALQGRCKMCSSLTTYECSVCRDEHVANPWICHTKKGKMCFPQHIARSHS
jgi:Transposase IS4